MNSVERNRLLLESDGFNAGERAQELAKELANANVYTLTNDRLTQAALTKRPSVVQAYIENRDLNFSVNSMADYAQLESCVLYYAVKALPQWWVNPLDSDNIGQSLSSIGQLFAFVDGTAITIEELGRNSHYSRADKERIVGERVALWHQDMAAKVNEAMTEIRGGRFGIGIFSTAGLVRWLSGLLLIVANAFIFILFALPSNQIKNGLLRPSSNDLATYVVYIPLVFVLLYDVVFLVYTVVFANKRRQENYGSKLVSFKAKYYFKTLADNAVKLLRDILDNYAKNTPFRNNDIAGYAPISDYSTSFAKIAEERQKNALHPLPALRNTFIASAWLTLFALIFAIVALSIMAQKGWFV